MRLSKTPSILWEKRVESIIQEGALARPGVICPYGGSQLAERCAWLAGHFDQHGKAAWEKARYIEPTRKIN